ncbi:MAG TPA: DUF434 domain-containing protein [Pyrinomonadaceae bacterium]|nr:DUF434 domain-containing protein [Pyrinomonadaceae bacterium]
MSPDRRQHRGAHPEDARLFGPAQLASLRTATSELSWLMGRGYALKSAVKLVGDRHSLNERQRLAVARAACADEQLRGRESRRLDVEKVRGEPLVVDGFNVMITTEAALGGGVLILCRDGCVRDLSSVHGSYRSVSETERAIALVGEALAALGAGPARWLLDRPVSNSGRLAARIRETAAKAGWVWSVEAVFNPDAEIRAARAEVAVTSDSNVLDGVNRWLNFNEFLLSRYLPEAWLIDLRV